MKRRNQFYCFKKETRPLFMNGRMCRKLRNQPDLHKECKKRKYDLTLEIYKCTLELRILRKPYKHNPSFKDFVDLHIVKDMACDKLRVCEKENLSLKESIANHKKVCSATMVNFYKDYDRWLIERFMLKHENSLLKAELENREDLKKSRDVLQKSYDLLLSEMVQLWGYQAKDEEVELSSDIFKQKLGKYRNRVGCCKKQEESK